MANIILIYGDSGTGKSTALRTLNPEETLIIGTLGKPLPFKGFKNIYNKEKRNFGTIQKWDKIIPTIVDITSKNQNIKNIILDDFLYVMRGENMERAMEKGYDKHTEIASHMYQIMNYCLLNEKLEDKNIVFIFHSEIEGSEFESSTKVSTTGKLLDKSFNPMHIVTIALYSEPKYDEDGNKTYGFYTNECKLGNKTIRAKSPDGMFEDIFIPNDLQFVIDKINEYYN